MGNVFLAVFIAIIGLCLIEFTSKLEFGMLESGVSSTDLPPTTVDENLADTQQSTSKFPSRPTPKFWLYTESTSMHMFELIEKVLLRLGLEKIEMDTTAIHDDWDFVWSFDYIKNISFNYQQLKFHQKINHIPGISLITSKDFLSTYTNSKYVPKGFRVAKDLIDYAEKNPNTRFVQKLTSSRGVSLKNVSEIKFAKYGRHLETFAQVFVEDPMLIAGHKFDFNIFVVIASVNPLRVYYYEHNTHFRFCPLPYDHNDFSNSGTYIVDDSHIQGSSFPEMNKYFTSSYTLKEAFDVIMKEKGHESTKVIYDQVEDCIRTILLEKEDFFIKEIDRTKANYGKFHFFELIRFDFLVDAGMKLHLMEVNLSPNLHAIGKNLQCKPMFQSVIYNYLNLVGVGSYLDKEHIGKFRDDEEEFLVHDSFISVNQADCMERCKDSCGLEVCQLCLHCMSTNQKYDLKIAYLEHVNIGEMKRILPPASVRQL
jgi:tubulin monoglycylase TTLL15